MFVQFALLKLCLFSIIVIILFIAISIVKNCLFSVTTFLLNNFDLSYLTCCPCFTCLLQTTLPCYLYYIHIKLTILVWFLFPHLLISEFPIGWLCRYCCHISSRTLLFQTLLVFRRCRDNFYPTFLPQSHQFRLKLLANAVTVPNTSIIDFICDSFALVSNNSGIIPWLNFKEYPKKSK